VLGTWRVLRNLGVALEISQNLIVKSLRLIAMALRSVINSIALITLSQIMGSSGFILAAS